MNLVTSFLVMLQPLAWAMTCPTFSNLTTMFVNLFCYRVAREVGAMAAALEGLDAIVFTGGIGENSPEVREKVCDRLGWLGVVFDHVANRAGALRLNATGSRVSVLRVPTDEEAVIARHAARKITD